MVKGHARQPHRLQAPPHRLVPQEAALPKTNFGQILRRELRDAPAA